MRINIKFNQPIISLGVLLISGEVKQHDFIIDTGFTGSCVFLLSGEQELLTLDFYRMEELEERQWITLGDGRKIPTFKAFIDIIFESEEEDVEVLLGLTSSENKYLLGMDFLHQNQKKLVLDFRSQHYELT